MKIVEIMEKHASELAALECLDNGKTWDFATKVDVDFAIRTFRYYAGWADKNQGKVSEVGGCPLLFRLVIEYRRILYRRARTSLLTLDMNRSASVDRSFLGISPVSHIIIIILTTQQQHSTN
jgi:hypothetical protein